MPPVQLFQFTGGIVCAEPAIDEATREAPIQPYLWTRRYMTL